MQGSTPWAKDYVIKTCTAYNMGPISYCSRRDSRCCTQYTFRECNLLFRVCYALEEEYAAEYATLEEQYSIQHSSVRQIARFEYRSSQARRCGPLSMALTPVGPRSPHARCVTHFVFMVYSNLDLKSRPTCPERSTKESFEEETFSS